MDWLLAHCVSAFNSAGGVWTVFFLGGLAGSLAHCLPMCGPLVACRAACAGCRGGVSAGSSAWAYHLGRFATYGALGFAAAWMSSLFAARPYWPVISSILVVLAGLLFLASAVFPGFRERFVKSMRGGFAGGALVSFMPCGLLYAALLAAATFADPWKGMAGMWLFALGTMPVLLLAGGGIGMLAARWPLAIDGIGRAGMAFNGLSLLVMAAKTVR